MMKILILKCEKENIKLLINYKSECYFERGFENSIFDIFLILGRGFKPQLDFVFDFFIFEGFLKI